MFKCVGDKIVKCRASLALDTHFCCCSYLRLNLYLHLLLFDIFNLRIVIQKTDKYGYHYTQTCEKF